MSRVAVLGASGCVGRQVCAAFTRSGRDVLAVARRPVAHLSAYPFRSVDVGVEDPVRIAAVLTAERVDVVVNVTGGWGTTEEEMRYAHVRLPGRLVEAVERATRQPRLVHVGTIHEYGPVPEETLIDETIVPAPETPYALTKLAGSETVLRASREHRIDGVVLRAVNLCGPYPAAPSFLGYLRRRLHESLAGSTDVDLPIADARRDYLDVRDAAEAVVLAAAAPVSGQVINIGSGAAVGMRDLVTLFVAAAGFPPERLRVLDRPVQSKGGDWTRADIRLAEKLLGWRPRIGLAESMRSMWESGST